MDTVRNEKQVEKSVTKTRVLRFSDLVNKLRERMNRLAHDPKALKGTLDNAYSALEKLEKLRRKKMIRLDMEIPRKLAKKLGNIEILQVNGVIRNIGDAAIVELLTEIKPSGFHKLTKIKNISFLALDTLETILVDRKITDISETVAEIDKKLDAQNRGALKSALQQMKELISIRNPETKKNKILLLQDRFSLCEHLFDQLYRDRCLQGQALQEKSESSTFSNKSKLTGLCEIGNQLPELLEPVILCKIAQIRLYQLQGELALAQEKAFELADYGAEILLEFKNLFSPQFFEEKTYKNIADFNPEKTMDSLKEKLIKPNEHMDYLINSILGFVLTIPAEKVQPPQEAGSNFSAGTRSKFMQQQYTFKAPLGSFVKIMTSISLIVLMGTVIIGFTTGPRGALIWDIPMVVLPLLILLLTCFFAITGYTLTMDCLYVKRPGWQSRVPLDSLLSADIIPKPFKGSIRLWGNGGLFAVSGRFRSKKLGMFRAFATDTSLCIVLKFSSRPPTVISPANPHRFLTDIKQLRNIR